MAEMAESMIERVARLLFKMFRSVPPQGEAWRDYEDDARAIMLAMRTPTSSMEHAGFETYLDTEAGYEVVPIWCAMIDAALRT